MFDTFAVGALAGLLSDAIVHPIDTLRARMQTSQSVLRGSLYSGFYVVMMGTVPGHALYFSSYEYTKRALTERYNPQSSSRRQFGVHLAAGFVADVFGSLAWTPMDVVKQRLQVKQQTSLSDTLGMVKHIYTQDGLRGFYRGFGAGLLVYGPYVSLYFALYEHWKKHFDTLPMFMLGAMVSASTSAALTTPLDVIKTRIQTQQPEPYKNIVDVIQKTLKKEGSTAFFKGIAPRIIWMSTGTALTMAFYEALK